MFASQQRTDNIIYCCTYIYFWYPRRPMVERDGNWRFLRLEDDVNMIIGPTSDIILRIPTLLCLRHLNARTVFAYASRRTDSFFPSNNTTLLRPINFGFDGKTKDGGVVYQIWGCEYWHPKVSRCNSAFFRLCSRRSILYLLDLWKNISQYLITA